MTHKDPTLHHIHWPGTAYGEAKPWSSALFALAFRPFFLAGACWAVIAIALWALWFSGLLTWQSPFPASLWHAHEMLFGFGAAIAVGFLLTAAQNWTGLASLRGKPLFLLSLLWLTARLSLLFSAFPPLLWLFMLTQLLWWCGVIYSLASLLVRAQSRNNYLFIPLLSVMALLNSGFVFAVSIQQFAVAAHSSHGVVLLFCLLLSIVGGRVIPFFTARALGLEQQKTPRLDKILLPLSILGTAMFLLGFFIELPLRAAADVRDVIRLSAVVLAGERSALAERLCHFHLVVLACSDEATR